MAKSIKLISWNVNGIRACVKNGFVDFLVKEQPDLLGLQEIKISDVARAKEQFDDAFAAIRRERPGALFVLADRLFLHHRARIVDFITQNRLPGVHAYQELVELGALMSFGPSYPGMHRRAAYYVDRILKGARPGDLPIEQPAKFELVIKKTRSAEY